MKNRLVIVTDLGCLRAYRQEDAAPDRGPRLELVEEFTPENAHARISDIMADSAGRFPRGGGAQNVSGDMSSGERNDLEREHRRRLIKQVGARLDALLGDEAVRTCLFAAGSEINAQLINELSPRARGKITGNVTGNFVKAGKAELLQRFF